MFFSRFSGLLRLSAVRQALLLLVLFSLISLVAWGATFFLVQREMLRGVDARLLLRMEAAVAALDAGGELPTPGDGETAVLVTNPRRDGFETRDAPGTETEMRYLQRTTEHGPVRLGENTERQEELLDLVAGGMTLSLLASLCAAALASLWLARRSQRRLDRINQGLSAVAGGDLSTRITLAGEDDLSLLAGRINATTARLEDAMMRMRVQSSNIAHDLRTPLARLRAEMESSLIAAEVDGRPVRPEAVRNALDQIDRITGTFEALLRLAKIESGAGRDAFRPVDLSDLVAKAGETFGPVVEDAGQLLRIDVHGAATIKGDQDMLIQLIANLIQNALRHGAARQTITLQVNGLRLQIWDEGQGIPPDQRETVLQPLYQGESTRQGEGVGLGLSLVRAIAELHDADLTLSDGPNGHGLCVTLHFPRDTNL